MKFKSNVELESLSNATTDTDKFVVSDSNILKYRTGNQLLLDIGAQAALTNPITGTGSSGQVSFFNGTTTQTGDNGLFWNNSTKRLGIGNTSPSAKLDVSGDILVNGINIGRGAGNIDTNTAVGQNALVFNTTGGFNTAVGRDALRFNTTGSFNTASGQDALRNNTTGVSNTAVGLQALFNNTTGGYNIAVGRDALFRNTTGGSNIGLGFDAGRLISNGSNQTITNNSIFIGTDTRALANNQTNQIVIGHQAVGVGSNSVVLGNDSITKTILKGNVGIGTTSPARLLTLNAATPVLQLTSPTAGATADNGFEIYLSSNVNGNLNVRENGALILSTNNTERMRITSTGNVGIGTTSPSNKLTVRSSGAIATLQTTATTGQNWLDFQDSVGASKGYVGYGASGTNDLFLTQLSASSNIALYNGGSIRLVVNSAGNVGIGTTSPSDKLHIFSASNPSIRISKTGDLGSGLQIGRDSSTLDSYIIQRENADLFIRTNNTEHMRITSAGNVGIGSTNPSAFGSQKFLAVASSAGGQVARFTDGANADLVLDNPSSGITRITAQFGTSGTLVFAKGTGFDETMRITSTGNVGIGNTAPAVKLDIFDSSAAVARVQGATNGGGFFVAKTNSLTTHFAVGDDACIVGGSANSLVTYFSSDSPHRWYINGSERMRITSAGNVGIGNTANLTGGGRLQVSGDIRTTGDVIAFSTSDQRLKNNLTLIPNSLEKITKLSGYSFDWNEKQDTYTGHDYGVIAQEVEALFPEMVQTRESGMKAVKYDRLIPVLIEAIKEQQKQIDELKMKIDGITN